MISYGLAENRNQLLVYDQFGGKGSNDRPSIHLPIFDIDKNGSVYVAFTGSKKIQKYNQVSSKIRERILQ